jgi:hypothetical protein
MGNRMKKYTIASNLESKSFLPKSFVLRLSAMILNTKSSKIFVWRVNSFLLKNLRKGLWKISSISVSTYSKALEKGMGSIRESILYPGKCQKNRAITRIEN